MEECRKKMSYTTVQGSRGVAQREGTARVCWRCFLKWMAFTHLRQTIEQSICNRDWATVWLWKEGVRVLLCLADCETCLYVTMPMAGTHLTTLYLLPNVHQQTGVSSPKSSTSKLCWDCCSYIWDIYRSDPWHNFLLPCNGREFSRCHSESRTLLQNSVWQ